MLRWALLSLTLLVGCGEIFSELPSVLSESLATDLPVRPAFGAIIDETSVPVRFDEGFTTQSAMKGGADLRHLQTPIKNQGGMGACTGFAIASLREFMLGRREQVQLSPLFMYRRELERMRVPLNAAAVDNGAYIHVGMQILKEEGIAPESYAPYLTGRAAYEKPLLAESLMAFPDRQAFSTARDFRVKKVVPITTLRDFRYNLSTGHPVVFAFKTFPNLDQTGPDGRVPKPEGRVRGGHAVLAVGFNDVRQEIIFKNSWSPYWGDKGYGYLPYEFVKQKLVWDAWTAI